MRDMGEMRAGFEPTLSSIVKRKSLNPPLQIRFPEGGEGSKLYSPDAGGAVTGAGAGAAGAGAGEALRDAGGAGGGATGAGAILRSTGGAETAAG